jgi:electron transport protein HydN
MNTFVIANPNKCIGCRTCEIACVVAHADKNIFTEESSKIQFYPRLSVTKTAQVSAPVQCRHCEDAPCANVCPNKCITNNNGVVLIDRKNCIGCKTCLMACPLGAIELVPEFNEGEMVAQQGLKVIDEGKLCFKDKMVGNKCDLCDGRENGPACVEVCPTDAFMIVQSDELKVSIKDKRKKRASELSNMKVK